MSSVKPTNKVAAGALAGAVTGLVIWAAKAFGHTDVPAEVAVSLSIVITFIVQYIVPDSAQEFQP